MFSRIRDLKPNHLVVAHLKTPFFVSMEQKPFKLRALELLKIGAKNYSKLLGIDYILVSEKFVNRDKYVLRFYEGNFLHLTGVLTKLTAKEFFDKCLNGTITNNDFDCDSTLILKGTVRHKLSHIISISTFFDNKIKCQESFVKGKVKCVIAASDRKYTLGFTGGKGSLNPLTLLHNDFLNEEIAIDDVKVLKVIR